MYENVSLLSSIPLASYTWIRQELNPEHFPQIFMYNLNNTQHWQTSNTVSLGKDRDHSFKHSGLTQFQADIRSRLA